MVKPSDPGIRSIYVPNSDNGELADLAHVYDRLYKMRMQRAGSGIETNWDKWEKQYEGYRDPKSEDDWQSNLVVNTTAGIVESQMSEIIDQHLKPRYLPRCVEDKPKAIVMNAASDYTWEVGKSDVELYKGTNQALVLGTGIYQEYYRKEKRMVQQLLSIGKNGQAKYEDKEVVDFDDCYLEQVDLREVYVDENARSFDGPYPARDCIRRQIMDYSAFKEFFQGPYWDMYKNAQYVVPGGRDTNYYQFYKPPQGLDRTRQVEVLWYWAKCPTPGRPNVSDSLIVVANDVVIVRSPNPYNHKKLPFVRQVDILRANSFYGKGESQLLESIQEEQTTLRRQLVDRNHLDIDKSFLMSTAETDLDEEDLIARPHALIPVSDPNNIKAVEYGDVAPSVFQSMSMLGDDAIRITGQDDRMQSVQSVTTATQAAILKQATLKRLGSKIWLLTNETLYSIGLLRESNIRQFYTQPKMEKIIGQKGTADYNNKVRDAYINGRLQMQGGQPYKKTYKNIRLSNQELVPTSNGFDMRKSKEPTFFELSPEVIQPTMGSFAVKITPMPSMPVSKPLQQEQVSSMFDRLVQFSDGVNPNGIYSTEKLGDGVLETYDFEPSEFKKDASPAQQMSQNLIPMQLQLASEENKEISDGKIIPSTPYAQEPHTQAHIAFIESPQIMQLPSNSPILAVLTKHIVGEIMAQQARQGALTNLPGGPTAPGTMGPPSPGATGPGGPPQAGPPATGQPYTAPSGPSPPAMPQNNMGNSVNPTMGR